MGGLRIETEEHPLEKRWNVQECCCLRDRGMRHTSLSNVATSRVVSVGALFVLRISLLIFLLSGAIWIGLRAWRDDSIDGDPPPMLCLPDWSYVATAVYFLMAAFACLRHTNVRPFTPHSSGALSIGESVRRSLASTATLFLLEISVVFQTIAVPVTWIQHSEGGRHPARALVSTLALTAVLVDLLLNRSRVEAKHAWIILAFLLAWAVQQVVWVYADSSHEACYGVFDAKRVHSLLTAIVASMVVVAVVFAYAALCAQRDRLTSQCGRSFTPDFEGPDVEEDVDQEAGLTGTAIRAPPASERSSVVNPIYAGAGSRMKRHWPQKSSASAPEHRSSITSNDTEMSSGEDLDPSWLPEDNQVVKSTGRSCTAAPPKGMDAMGRWPDRAAAGVTGGGLTAHPSSWAGYGGAAAWVRSSERDITPSSRGGKAGGRRGPSRF